MLVMIIMHGNEIITERNQSFLLILKKKKNCFILFENWVISIRILYHNAILYSIRYNANIFPAILIKEIQYRVKKKTLAVGFVLFTGKKKFYDETFTSTYDLNLIKKKKLFVNK